MAHEHARPPSQARDAFCLQGRVAWVTGSARGIGRAIARELASAGATVVCSDVDDPTDTVAEILEAGGSAWGEVADVTSVEAVTSLVDGIVARAGRLDVAVNNAGVHASAAALDVTPELIERINRININGVLYGSQAAARVMIAQGGGSIVNVASTAIDSSMAGNLAYSASKAAVRQMTRVMAREWGKYGVRVNAVAPGWIETQMTRASNRSTSPDETDAQALVRKKALVAASRALPLEGSPDFVAHAVRFLASDAAAWITGQALRVDGGMAMAW